VSLSFGLSNLNTVERRKIRSGSSAAKAAEPVASTKNNAKTGASNAPIIGFSS